MPRRHTERIEWLVLLVLLEPNLGSRNPWDGVRYLQALLAEMSAGVRPGRCRPVQRTGSYREAESARHNTDLFVEAKPLGSRWALTPHPKPDTVTLSRLSPSSHRICILVLVLVACWYRSLYALEASAVAKQGLQATIKVLSWRIRASVCKTLPTL